jgi:ATP-binding cassette subfamily F protein 3
MTQDQSGLDPALSPLETIQHAFDNETAARTYLAYFLLTGEQPLKPNSPLSYGQRARLALAQMVMTGCNVLLLDEPINHLDIPARAQLGTSQTCIDALKSALVLTRSRPHSY